MSRRHKILRLEIALLIAILNSIGAEFTHAQAPTNSSQTVRWAKRTQPARKPAPATDCCTYWMVSSRPCQQKSHSQCCGCQFNYYRCNENTRCVRSSLKSLLESLQPGVPIAVVVHGSFTSLQSITNDSRYMNSWLQNGDAKRPLHVIFFTWPSDGPYTGLLHLDVARLGRKSARTAFYLSDLLAKLPADRPVSLIGHSHGARTVAATLHLQGGGAVQGYRLSPSLIVPRRFRAVLTGAAIDHNWFNPGERYGRALCSVESLLNVRNKHDNVLGFYPLRKPFSGRALARTGLTPWDLQKLGWLNTKVSQLDVTSIVGAHHFWQYYYRHSEIAEAISPWVFFPKYHDTKKTRPKRTASLSQ